MCSLYIMIYLFIKLKKYFGHAAWHVGSSSLTSKQTHAPFSKSVAS